MARHPDWVHADPAKSGQAGWILSAKLAFSWLRALSVSWASLVPPGGLSLSKSAAGTLYRVLRECEP